MWSRTNGNLQFRLEALSLLSTIARLELWVAYNMVLDSKRRRRCQRCQCLVSFVFNYENSLCEVKNDKMNVGPVSCYYMCSRWKKTIF